MTFFIASSVKRIWAVFNFYSQYVLVLFVLRAFTKCLNILTDQSNYVADYSIHFIILAMRKIEEMNAYKCSHPFREEKIAVIRRHLDACCSFWILLSNAMSAVANTVQRSQRDKKKQENVCRFLRRWPPKLDGWSTDLLCLVSVRSSNKAVLWSIAVDEHSAMPIAVKRSLLNEAAATMYCTYFQQNKNKFYRHRYHEKCWRRCLMPLNSYHARVQFTTIASEENGGVNFVLFDMSLINTGSKLCV